jgi:hypothetical protein
MYKMTKATIITAGIQSVTMAALFVRGNPEDTFFPLLALSALAHSTVFTLFTRELATLSIQKKRLEYWVEFGIGVLTAIICGVHGLQMRIDLHNGKLIPNGDIASFGLLGLSTSLVVTVVCFFIFVTRSKAAMTEIQSELDTDRQPLS